MSQPGRLRVLLDTGPLYALLEDRDGKHGAAVALLETLETEGAEVALAYPAALEAHRLMLTRERVSVSRPHRLITGALEVFSVELPTRDDVIAAQRNLQRYDDQKISLTDATIAAMSQREKMVVATFDEKQRHFELMGASVYGSSG